MSLHELPSRFRAKAKSLKPYAPAAARAFAAAASAVERELRDSMMEALDLQQAAFESGYSPAQLKRMIREGQLQNVGSPRKQRVLRMHLPKRPGPTGVASDVPTDVPSRDQVARAVASGGGR